MEKTYQPENIERQWYENWESKGYFRPSGEGQSYSIAIPPPNVTGSLHMGHAFQHTINWPRKKAKPATIWAATIS